PKPEDMSESFKRMRREARAGTLVDGAWVEFGADPNADLDDRAQWRMANPSYPKRTPAQSLLRLKRKLTSADWRREGMGIWDDDTSTSSLIPAAQWGGLRVYEAPPGTVGYGVKFSADGSRVALAVAVRPDDDSPVHVEVVRSESMALGTAWLVDWLSTRWRGCLGIAIDGKSGSGQLVNSLRAARVPARVIVIPTLDQVISAHAMLLEAVVSDPAGVSHFGQAGLDDAVAGATKRPIQKSGGWGWQPIGDAVDVTPLEAVTFAHLVAAMNRRKVSSGSSNGRRVVVLT
ncbi:MAG TPA: terminase, partial [Coriobacteriia bacterium]|nr:terminase [Coriobacteriia bacterium]